MCKNFRKDVRAHGILCDKCSNNKLTYYWHEKIAVTFLPLSIGGSLHASIWLLFNKGILKPPNKVRQTLAGWQALHWEQGVRSLLKTNKDLLTILCYLYFCIIDFLMGEIKQLPYMSFIWSKNFFTEENSKFCHPSLNCILIEFSMICNRPWKNHGIRMCIFLHNDAWQEMIETRYFISLFCLQEITSLKTFYSVAITSLKETYLSFVLEAISTLVLAKENKVLLKNGCVG